MDPQEFQEADILWPENSGNRNDGSVDGGVACNAPTVLPKVSSPELSVPVHVRRRKRRSRSWTSDQSTDGSSGDDGGDVGCTNDAKRTVPPHVLVERRMRFGGRTAAYSMCAGKGRTLKGRDLRSVRNLVLEMTGFIEK